LGQEQVIVIDEDLGVSGSGFADRSGFARMTAEVALGPRRHRVRPRSLRVARNNADCIACLISAASPTRWSEIATASIIRRFFNDRLVLGLKGIMAEAELHILRARLEGGIRNKAARGELRRGLPVGFVWGEKGRRSALPSRRIRRQHRSHGLL